MTKKILSIITLLCLAVTSAWADNSGSCGTNVTYSYDESTHTLTISGTGEMTDWGSGNPGWYSYAGNISSIVIENGVTHIGVCAFKNCNNSSLTSITIPSSVTSIGTQAFEGCSSLTSMAIPASVTSIGQRIFLLCSDLATITVDAGNTAYDSRDNCNAIIEKSSNTLVTGCKGSTIPDGVTSIGASAFVGCAGLTTIAIPSSVTSIGDDAFHECTGLATITIPSSVTSIGMSAFGGCSGLTTITIPSSVTSIGGNAFYGCSGLTTVTIPSSVTSIGGGAFYGCTHLSSVTVYATACTLEGRAFDDCASDLEIYVFIDKVDYYQEAMNWWNYASKIADITNTNGTCGASGDDGSDVRWVLTGESPNYTLTIMKTGNTGEMADGGSGWDTYKGEISSIVIENGVTSIGGGAFMDCNNSSLTSITIPSSVTSIGTSAFDGCSSLATITLNSNPVIGESAFSGIKDGATVTMNLAGNEGKTGEYWMTFYNQNYSFTADDNTTVYKAAVSGSWVNLTEVDDIPKGNAAILKSSGAAITMTLTESATADYSGNDLKGTDADTDASGMTYAYCLSKNTSGEVGFYKFTGNGENAIIPANRAYLVIAPSSGARSFYAFGDGDATAIENLKPAMVGEEGDGPVFDLSGRSVVGQPRKGIYVRNGKKVVIK